MKKLFIILILVFVGYVVLQSQNQRLELHYSETNNYPYITTGFKLFNSAGDEIRNTGTNQLIKASDIVIQEMENGVMVQRPVMADPACPGVTQTTFSAILTCDVSTSMGEQMEGGKRKIDVLKEVLLDFIKNFDTQRTEVAITLFAGEAIGHPEEPNLRPFTNDKDSLKRSVESLGKLYPGTNWSAALLEKVAQPFVKNLSALYYCQEDVRKYKPVIILLTDYNSSTEMDEPFRDAEVRQIAIQRNATIYVIQLGTQDMDPSDETALNQLALIGRSGNDGTPNIWLKVNNSNQLKNIYDEILIEAGQMGDPPPCYVTWKTSCEGGSATFTFPNHDLVSDVTEYTIDNNKKPELQATPALQYFRNIAPGNTKTQTITLKALKNIIEINDIEIATGKRYSGRYRVSDWGVRKPPPITIPKDSIYTIEVEYIPTDSLYSEATIGFNGNICTNDSLILKSEMYPYVENVDMGNLRIGYSLDTTITQLFCNKTGVPIQIKSIKIDGADKSEFEIVDYSSKGLLDSGECLTIALRCNPTSSGIKTAKIVISTDYNNMIFEGSLTNKTYDGMEVPDVKLVDFGNIPFGTVVDTIFTKIFCNTTSIPINILSVALEGENKEDFEIVDWQPDSSINPNECISISLKCKPLGQQLGIKTAKIVFETDYFVPKFEAIITCNVIEGQSVYDDNDGYSIIKLYPNPASDEVSIIFPDNLNNHIDLSGNAGVTIYNSMGMELKTIRLKEIRDLDNFKINIEEMQSGVYFVGFKSNNLNEIVPLSIIK